MAEKPPEKIWFCGECKAVHISEDKMLNSQCGHYFSCSKGWSDPKPEYTLSSVSDKKVEDEEKEGSA